jgi:hypothetical protein
LPGPLVVGGNTSGKGKQHPEELVAVDGHGGFLRG